MDEMGQEILKVFQRQQENSRSVAATSYQVRIKKLERLLECVVKNRDRIKEAIYSDFRKPPEEVDLTEVYPLVSEVRHIIKNLKTWLKPVRVPNSLATPGTRCRVTYQPKGICLVISPWNYPFQLAMGPLVNAIAAGNCVIVKPSEFSPHTSTLIKELLNEVFELQEVAVFTGDQQVARQLLQLPFNHIYFTGSPSVGKIVMAEAAKNLSSVTLELGGKSPVVVNNTDLQGAVEKIIWGKLINAGQTCIAPDYVLLPRNKLQEFISRAKESIVQRYGDLERISENRDYCRIINQRHFLRLKKMVNEAVDRGGKLDFGGIMREEDLYVSPTLISDPPLTSILMQEEIFGPVLPVITYEKLTEALETIHARPRPLVLYIFSSDQGFIRDILENTHSGDAVINNVVMHFANVNLPFGGINNSGIGKSHGVYGFKEFSHMRSVMYQGRINIAKMFYPPYGQKAKKMLNMLFK
ncbi:MAG: Aldehyde dehydrogenase [Candidatus Dichloromethanomonas elyunquensis]|nr:MAG: Aldehyde dehydrogenase [Candidatus Dichloromethanomonas elyunquensis]